jgi:hypothetical protein
LDDGRTVGRTTWTGGLGLALAAGIAVAAATLPRAGQAAGDTVVYPDLRSIVPAQQLAVAHDDTGKRFLRFEHTIHNAGAGRLEVRPLFDPATGDAAAFQRLYTRSASGEWQVVREVPSEGRFVFHAEHGHYHVPFAAHGLFGVGPRGSVGPPVAPSHKVGYCLGDTFVVSRNANTPERGGGSLYEHRTCTDPRAIRGISPGWGDQYKADIEGQAIDLGTVADGVWWFVSTADPENFFEESDETNNSTALLLLIQADAVRLLPPPVWPPTG